MADNDKKRLAAPVLPEPPPSKAVTYACPETPRLVVWGPRGKVGRFADGRLTTDDPYEQDVLDRTPGVERVGG